MRTITLLFVLVVTGCGGPKSGENRAEATKIMSGEHNGSESQRRKVQMRAPYIVGEYAEAAGLKVTDVIDDLAGMRIFARPQFAMSQEIIEKLAAKHGIQVEFIPRQ